MNMLGKAVASCGMTIALAAGAVLVLPNVAGASGATSAPGAASTPSGTTVSVSYRQVAPASGTTASPLVAINCTLRIDYPHKSGHVKGTVNITLTTTCHGKSVASSYMYVALYKTGFFGTYLQNQNSRTETHVSEWTIHTAVECTLGTQMSTFFGVGTGLIKTSGSTWTATVESPVKSLACGTAGG